MSRHSSPWHQNAPAHLVVVPMTWSRSVLAAEDAVEVRDTYRRCRQRLADALVPEPAGASSSAVGARSGARTATAGRAVQNEPLLPAARVPLDSRQDDGVAEHAMRRCRGVEIGVREDPSVLFAPDVLAAATARYDPALPYHNAGHALRAVACGERLLRICATAGVRVDATVVRLALLFHDAGYGTDPSSVDCPDAEAYAASLARQALTGSVPPPVLDDIESAILATRHDAQPETPEAKLVRAADLADLAAGYDTFAANAEALRTEHEQLSGARMSPEDWGRSVDQLLSGYLREPLWPVALLDDGDGPGFHATARANLRRYLRQLT